jgi:hypothetical protein
MGGNRLELTIEVTASGSDKYEVVINNTPSARAKASTLIKLILSLTRPGETEQSTPELTAHFMLSLVQLPLRLQ